MSANGHLTMAQEVSGEIVDVPPALLVRNLHLPASNARRTPGTSEGRVLPCLANH